MAPSAQSARPQPRRTVRVYHENGMILLATDEQKGRQWKRTTYFLDRIPSDFGQGFRLTKSVLDGGETYHVNIAPDPAQDSCECPGHLRWGHRTICRHRALLRKLIELGRV